MEKIVIFPGSFDPFTRGHEMVVEEALTLFDRVIIAIGDNITKRGFIATEQRKCLIDDIYANETRVECHIYDCLTGDFAQQVGAVAIVRGLRNTLDFEMERTIDSVNRKLHPNIKTISLFTPAQVSHISSSAVRELLKFGADVSEMMPQGVAIENYLKTTK